MHLKDIMLVFQFKLQSTNGCQKACSYVKYKFWSILKLSHKNKFFETFNLVAQAHDLK